MLHDPGPAQEFLASRYVAWTVKLVYYCAGAASTFVAAWASSKIHIYHEARTSHRDELKEQILEPIRAILQRYGAPHFSIEYGVQQYNVEAHSDEPPETHGPLLTVDDPGLHAYELLSAALLEDARMHHYKALLADWENLRDNWAAHIDRTRKWILETAQQIVLKSALRPFPPRDNCPPYIMHLKLAVFCWARIVQSSRTALRIDTSQKGEALYDADTCVAAGPSEVIITVPSMIDGIIEARRLNASQIRDELTKLQSETQSLSRQFSIAIAAKKLPYQCPLVDFI
jgi:hypothetical protein